MRRRSLKRTAVPIVAAIAVVAGCSDGSDEDSKNDAAPAEASYCVAYVRFTAEMSAESARVEQGEGPLRSNPYTSPAFKAFASAAPADIQDDLEVVTELPVQPGPDFEAAAREIDERLEQDCHLGEDVTSPLSPDCREQAAALEQQLSQSATSSGEALRAFAADCRPADDPYRALDDLCAGLVYAHFVSPSVEGIVNVGGPTHDDDQEIAARFLQDCPSAG